MSWGQNQGTSGDPDRSLRDVVALSTLPAIWLGAEPHRIAEILAAALSTTLGADLVLVRLSCSENETFDVAQTARNETSRHVAEDLGPRIVDWARNHDPDELLHVPNPTGEGTLRLTVRPLAFGAECGAIAAGFLREGAPNGFQHLLLNVAASQATAAVQNVRLLHSLQRSIAERERSENRERQASLELEILHRVSRNLAGELDLESLLQNVTDAAWRLSGAKFGAFFYNQENSDGGSYLLYALSGAPRQAFEKLGMPRNTKLFEPTFAGEAIVRLDDVQKDARYGRNPPHRGMPKGHLPVRSYLAVPVVSRSRAVLGGLFLGHPQPGVFSERTERLVAGIASFAAVAIDNARLYASAQEELAERKRAVATQQLLLRELDHRVKNTLANVQSIAQQTLRHAADPSRFVDDFNGRIRALSVVHTLLTASRWRRTSLRTLVGELLGSHDQSRLQVAGPDVDLEPQMTQHLAMVLHELLTNAQKHGALASPHGEICFRWRAEGGMLVMNWIETAAAAEQQTKKQGFGTKLIERSAEGHGGSARMTVGSDGIEWEIVLPLSDDPLTKRDSASAPEGASRSYSPRHDSPKGETEAWASGKRILIVEDEPLVGLDLADALAATGLEVAGPAVSIEGALEIIGSAALDGALLDVNLNGTTADQIAMTLVQRNVPFAFVTGYASDALPEQFRHVPRLSKPFGRAEAINLVRRLLGREDKGPREGQPRLAEAREPMAAQPTTITEKLSSN